MSESIKIISGHKSLLYKDLKEEIEVDPVEEINAVDLSEPIKIRINAPDIKIEHEEDGFYKPILRYNAVNNIGRDDTPYSLKRGPWDDVSSKLLIKSLAKYPSAYFFLDGETNRITYWELIRQTLEEHGYKFSLFQVRMHWRSLMKVYKKTVDSNELKGTHKECQYYKEMTECLGEFDREATLCLINHVVSYNKGQINKSGSLKLRMKAWVNIAKKMQSLGYRYQPYQLQARWRILIQVYQLAVRHNTKHPDDIIKTAYHDELADVYDYVPPLNGKNNPDYPEPMPSRQHHQTFSLKDERTLLHFYEKYMHKFMETDQYSVWCEIYKEFIEETNISVSMQQVRNCFYEMKRRLAQVKEHNSNPGAIHKTARHSEILERIYSVYDCWPHNRTKMNSLIKKKNRQFHTQMMWTEPEIQALLSIYPEVLVDYQSSTEPLPYVKLSQAIANKLIENGYSKRPALEVEIIMQQLRRGHEKQNLHNFSEQFNKILILEDQLGFKAPVSEFRELEESENSNSNSTIEYWGQEATLILLKSIKDHYNNCSVGEPSYVKIQRKLAQSNYHYTSLDCKEYFYHLKRIYQNAIRYLRSRRRITKPFIYALEMQEVFAAHRERQANNSLGMNSQKRSLSQPSGSSAKRIRIEKIYSGWSKEDDQMLIACVQNVQNICHSWKDFIHNLDETSSLWEEALQSIKSDDRNLQPSCHERFQEILREYVKSSYSTLILGKPQSQQLLDEMEDLVLTFCIHDTNADSRDFSWGIQERQGELSDWEQEDIIELIFILAELNQQQGLSPDAGMWIQVSSMLLASHRHFAPEDCRDIFSKIFKQYLLFWQRNLYCKSQNKTYPPFYFKIFSLFGSPEHCPFIMKLLDLSPGESRVPQGNLLLNDRLFLRWLHGLRGDKCHPVPRLKMLEKMVLLYYDNFGKEIEPSDIWSRLVHLHYKYLSSLERKGSTGSEQYGLMDAVWTRHENPLQAYNFIAYDLPLWEKVCHWSSNSLDYFLSECTTLALECAPDKFFEDSDFFSHMVVKLQNNGHSLNSNEAQLLLKHFIQAALHGGYSQWRGHIALMIILHPSLGESVPSRDFLNVSSDKLVEVPFCPQIEADPSVENSLPSSPAYRAAAQALFKYSLQCRKETKSFVNLIRESHREEMNVLKKICDFFKKFNEAL